MSPEPLSPELALVDPELGARARAALPSRGPETPRPQAARVVTAAPAAAPATHEHGRYPLWARITATLWVLVIGVLIGGAAVPHAQDRPRVVPPAEDVLFCEQPTPETPSRPPPGSPLNPSGIR